MSYDELKTVLEKIDSYKIKIKEQYEDIKYELVENLIRSRIEKKEAEKTRLLKI